MTGCVLTRYSRFHRWRTFRRRLSTGFSRELRVMCPQDQLSSDTLVERSSTLSRLPLTDAAVYGGGEAAAGDGGGDSGEPSVCAEGGGAAG